MNIKKVIMGFFSGLGTALIIWGLTFFNNQKPSPTYCKEIYSQQYKDIKSLKEYLLKECYFK
jgi:hypothetical protein